MRKQFLILKKMFLLGLFSFQLFITLPNCDQVPVTPKQSTTVICERHWWQSKPGTQLTRLSGSMTFDAYRNNGSSFQVYLEREIDLDNNNFAEFIISYRSPGSMQAFVSYIDNGTYLNMDPFIMNDVQIGDTIAYFFSIRSDHYYISIENARTGEKLENSVYDATMSTRILASIGSSEIYPHNITGDFLTQSTIVTDWAYDANTSNWHRPNEKFDFSLLDPDNDYVEATSYATLSDGRHQSVLRARYTSTNNPYNSIQSRVQRDITDPWDTHKVIKLGNSIRIGTMFDGTGYFAEDRYITQKVTGPYGYSCQPKIGEYIFPPYIGDYTVVSNTTSNPGLFNSSTFTVGTIEAHPYSSIQCRVQRDITDPWDTHKTIDQGASIRIGTMHDGTGYFAENKYIIQKVTGPCGYLVQPNIGDYIKPPYSGEYEVVSTTISNPKLTNRSTFTVK